MQHVNESKIFQSQGIQVVSIPSTMYETPAEYVIETNTGKVSINSLNAPGIALALLEDLHENNMLGRSYPRLKKILEDVV